MSKLRQDKEGNYYQSGPKLRNNQKEFWFEKQEVEKKNNGKCLWCKQCKQSKAEWRFSATQRKKFPPTCQDCIEYLQGIEVKVYLPSIPPNPQE